MSAAGFAPFATTDQSIGTFENIRRDCEEIAHTEPGNTQRMASLLSQMSLSYFQDVRMQAQQSFYSALVAAAVGTSFFIYATWLTMNRERADMAHISLIAGGLTQVISAINFYLYARAARQFSSFHICLERMNRFLLGNTLCENLSDVVKRDKMRGELIRVVAHAPMLMLDAMDGARSETRKGGRRAKPSQMFMKRGSANGDRQEKPADPLRSDTTLG